MAARIPIAKSLGILLLSMGYASASDSVVGQQKAKLKQQVLHLPTEIPASPVIPEPSPASVPKTEKRAGRGPRNVQITRRSGQNNLNVLVHKAYIAYQQGQFDTAQKLYDQVLQRDAQSRDALLGRAAIYQKNAHTQAALDLYRRLLLRNPRDHDALAGFSSLTQQGDIRHYIANLRVLLKQTPHSASLNYALGSLLSRQQRWAQAQRYFFTAFSHDEQNPDIAYNLAVCLDQLGKSVAAVTFYRRALSLANSRASRFNHSKVRLRLQVLEPKDAG